MIKPLWSAIKLALIVAFAIWAMKRTGSVEINWMDYSVTVHIGVVLLCGVAFLFLVLGLYRLLLGVFSIPKNWMRQRERKKYQKGLRALTLGLTALSGGDTRLAGYHAHQTRKFIPNYEALSLMIEAQVARLKGKDEDAYIAFSRLLKDKDAAFMGMRGLLLMALEKGDYKRALELCRQASRHYRHQPWVLQISYELQIHERQWDSALKTLKLAEKKGALTAAQAQSDRVAVEILKGDRALEDGHASDAERHYKKALQLDKSFVPAAERFARIYITERKFKKAASIVQETWKHNPHPVLAALWKDLAPENKLQDTNVRLRWFEKLIAYNPQSALGYRVAAEAAIADSLWGEAQRFLEQAEDIEQSAPLYRLWADMEERRGNFDKMRFYEEKAETEKPAKVWICRETGRIYERWHPIAAPHGSFNTIVWDHPENIFAHDGTSLAALPVRKHMPRLLTES